MRVLAITAVKDICDTDENGNDVTTWTWDDWDQVGEIGQDTFDTIWGRDVYTVEWFVINGYLGLNTFTDDGQMLADVDDDGYNITISDRASGEPLFAIEYGPCNI